MWTAAVLCSSLPCAVTGQDLAPTARSSRGPLGRLIGDNFRISDTATIGGDRSLATAVAYNSRDDEYLVVWSQRDFAGSTSEILGQRLDTQGALLGDPIVVSQTVVAGDEIGALSPDIAYAQSANEYLVVFQSDRLGRDRFEIFGQRLTAGGTEIGKDFRISNAMDRSFQPKVVHNRLEDEYLVVWYANSTLFVVDLDIFGQRIDAAAMTFGEVGDDFRISQMSDPINNRTALNPDLAFNDLENEYLVVWQSDGGGLPQLTTEIFGQRLSSIGEEVGANDFRISRMSDAGEDRDGVDASVAYDGLSNSFAVIWSGDGGSLGDDEFEVFGQLLDGVGIPVGGAFQISTTWSMGGIAVASVVAIAPADSRLVVGWSASFDTGTAQIRGRELDTSGMAVSGEFAISPEKSAYRPSIAYNDMSNELMIAWDDGDVVGQRYSTSPTVDIDLVDRPERPAIWLGPNYPNPFSQATTITFVLGRPGQATLWIRNLAGRVVEKRVAGFLTTGLHDFVWNASDLSSGVYLCTLEIGGVRVTRSLIVAR